MASWVSSFLGGGAGQTNTATDAPGTIERLADRVSTASLLEDRRDAIRALKGLAKDYQQEVGSRCLNLFLRVIKGDFADAETMRYVIDTLLILVTVKPDQAASTGPVLGVTFTEIIVRDAANIPLLAELLTHDDAFVRHHTVQLFTALLTNMPDRMQECILQDPDTITRLCEMLADHQEYVRNEAILLCIELTKSNDTIQKILVFGDAFDRLLTIMHTEGLTEGGLVIQDCLSLLHNLLNNNSSNQNSFRENSYIPSLAKFLKTIAEDITSISGRESLPVDSNAMPPAKARWAEQKTKNVLLFLEFIRLLVPVGNSKTTEPNQKALLSSGVIPSLSTLGFSEPDRIPTRIRSYALDTLGDVIRGYHAAQEVFAAVQCGTESSIVHLVKAFLDPHRSLPERLAALNCFQCYLHSNVEAQMSIVSTLSLDAAKSAQTVQIGALISNGIFSPNDSLTNWFACLALAGIFDGGSAVREKALSATVSTRLGETPTTLLHQCVVVLTQVHGDLHLRVGLLRLLCGWMNECPAAVTAFLESSVQGVPHLVRVLQEQSRNGLEKGMCAVLLGLLLAYNDNRSTNWNFLKVQTVITQHVGKEAYTTLLHSLSHIDSFVRASRNNRFLSGAAATVSTSSTASQATTPRNSNAADEILVDHNFTKFYKSSLNAIEHALTATSGATLVHSISNNGLEGLIDRHSISNVQPLPSNSGTATPVHHAGPAVPNAATAEFHTDVVGQFQQIIRSQDAELSALKKELATLNNKYAAASLEVTALKNELASVKSVSLNSQSSVSMEELETARQNLVHERSINQKLRAEVETLKHVNTGHVELEAKYKEQTTEMEDLLMCLAVANEKAKLYKERTKKYETVSDSDDDEDDAENE